MKSENRSSNHREGTLWIFAACLVIVWVGFFLGGILIDTGPHRGSLAAIASPHGCDLCPLLRSALVVFLFYTPTNIAFLSVLSGMLGGVGNLVHLGPDSGDERDKDRSYPLLSALVRGFAVYLVLISGVILVTLDPVANPSADAYVRLAGLISAFSFAASYSPRFFARAAERIMGVKSP